MYNLKTIEEVVYTKIGLQLKTKILLWIKPLFVTSTVDVEWSSYCYLQAFVNNMFIIEVKLWA